MRPRLWRQDLAWAGFILLLGGAMGLVQHWPLVKVSWQGELAAHLEKMRAQRREEKFQGVKTLSLAQAYALHRQGKALFIDARPAEEYQELHIAGAINIPVEALATKGAALVAGIPKDREIVAYCGQVQCDAALNTAEKLQALGFGQVQVFLDGFQAWDEAGYPAETSK